MKMSFCGYAYIFAGIFQNMFYKSLSIYAFVKILGIIRKHQIFFSIDFHVDIDIKTIDAYFYHFLIFL